MSRLRVKKDFNKRSVSSNSKEPMRKFYLAFEGSKTEPDYFNGINNHKAKIGISELIEIISLERKENDTLSHPNHILSGVKEYMMSNESIYDVGFDEVWLIFDRDEGNVLKSQLESIKKECDELKYSIALSNPTFEFWLLCHFEEIEDIDKDDMLQNKKVSNAHSFISKQLTGLLSNGYNKTKINFNDFIDKIDKAIKLSKSYATDFESLKDNLGSNIGLLIEELKK